LNGIGEVVVGRRSLRQPGLRQHSQYQDRGQKSAGEWDGLSRSKVEGVFSERGATSGYAHVPIMIRLFYLSIASVASPHGAIESAG